MHLPAPDMEDSLEAGSFYLYSPQARRLGFLSLRGSGEGEGRVKALLRSSSAESEGHGGKPSSAAASLTAGSVAGSPASYPLPSGAALVVRFGLAEVYSLGLGLHRLHPNVHYEPASRTACVFSGHLANLDELAERYGCAADPLEGPISPSSILAARADPRQLAAEVILRMYYKERGGDLLVLLSELQGQYAFAIFDGEKRQVFAARDSSGSEPLFYELGEDGGVSLSNGQPSVPYEDGEGRVQWSELPAGHFITGRTPKVQQFALTPAQLTIRENYERSMDEEMSPRAFAMMTHQRDSDMRRSLSPERGSNLFVY